MVANPEEAERAMRQVQQLQAGTDLEAWAEVPTIVGEIPTTSHAANGDADLSPPRKYRHDSPDPNPQRKRPRQQASVPALGTYAGIKKRKRHDSPDVDPPQQHHDGSPDISPARRKRQASPDVSPPRRTRHDSPDMSPPRRARHDSPDASLPRRKRQADNDASPPRRKRHMSPKSSPKMKPGETRLLADLYTCASLQRKTQVFCIKIPLIRLLQSSVILACVQCKIP